MNMNQGKSTTEQKRVATIHITIPRKTERILRKIAEKEHRSIRSLMLIMIDDYMNRIAKEKT